MNTFNNANMFNNKLSVYIPRITPEWAHEAIVAEVFHRNELGLVERVDLVCKQSEQGNFYYQAFVHMKWVDTQCARNIQKRIMNPLCQARLVHDDPSYWLLLENKNPMTATEVRLEKRVVELESRCIQQSKVALGHLNRIMELETHAITKMNYWCDPALYEWTVAPETNNTNNGIAPLWCHPVNEPTPTPTPSWCNDGLESANTMNTYAKDAERFQATECYDGGPYDEEHDNNMCDGPYDEEHDNICDYYDYYPYDMDIIE